jgi:anaphase-promoting complex subunit 4
MDEDLSDDGTASFRSRRYPIGFRILYQKQLPFPARVGLAAWSPQLDLFALVTVGDNILLYRINGQRVWGVPHKFGTSSVSEMRWRPDGMLRGPPDIRNAWELTNV